MTEANTSPTGRERSALRMQPESRASTVVVLGVVVCAVTMVWYAWRGERAAVEFLILLIAVVGLYIYSGGSGVVSFGHVGFMAVGGYCSVIFTLPRTVKLYRLSSLPTWLAHLRAPVGVGLLVAIIGGAVAGALFGTLIWRLSGLSASIATLTLLLIVYSIAGGWEGVTGGRGAVPSVPRMSSLPPTLLAALATVAIAGWYQRTRYGRLLRATRDDPAAANSLGVVAERVRWVSMVLSGAALGLAGGFYVHFVGSVSPDFFYVPMTFTLLSMLVVGGMRSLSGAVLGTVVIRFVRELLTPLDDGFSLGPASFGGKPGLRFVALGLVLLVMLFRRPEGLTKGREATCRLVVQPLGAIGRLRRRVPAGDVA